MEWLNYHHLYYFWTVARLGSIVAACDELGLRQPTISAQIRQLERALGEKLFERQGRGLALTDVGTLAYEYAEEIFSIGREFMNVIHQHPSGRPLRLKVGLSDAVPKLVASKILKPFITDTPDLVHLIVLEGKTDALVEQLASHAVDVVLSDEPAGANTVFKTYSHVLGESEVGFFATATLARRLKKTFPASLDGAPAILPGPHTPLRRVLDRWFAEKKIEPLVVAECDDNALVKTLARDGAGFVAAPTVVSEEVGSTFRLKPVGNAEGCREGFYAISVERRIKNPAVLQITARARTDFLA